MSLKNILSVECFRLVNFVWDNPLPVILQLERVKLYFNFYLSQTMKLLNVYHSTIR
ncbi:hypothetical protein [Spiroplasma poulsonii]|uniref:hypothetical protein n=1 Tax=Spiroplasma poulsonii TaxID=2138 RepID=UPI001F4C5C2C|nr:hypothetical protein [Spiroplasma poulsonii]UNF62585.1 hypothetical protein MNU24_03775 [Spiroplasma poulsonii]